jgi:hypothetical protein
VINPSNIGSEATKTVVVWCNTSYNSYDPYGNVVTEPIYVERTNMMGNDNESKLNLVLMDGYFNVTCQLNENTEKLNQNKRFILGKKPYYITGFTDFIQEFSGDRESVHLLNFTARIEEPTELDDVSENFIANGNAYIFGSKIVAPSQMSVGDSVEICAYFTLNGADVESTVANPIDWIFRSSNKRIADFDDSESPSTLLCKAIGETTIQAKLAQNPDIKSEAVISVTSAEKASYVAFSGVSEGAIKQYSSATYTASYFENGVETDETVNWIVSGAEEEDYETVIDGNSITVRCLSASAAPLTLTASYGLYSASVSVVLEGY